MLPIKKKYIVDERHRKVAVQLDIETFEKIEKVLEDYALGKLLEESGDEERLSVNDAKAYYKKLKKSK